MTEDSIDLDRCIWDSDYRQHVKQCLNTSGADGGMYLHEKMRSKLARYWAAFSRREDETT